VVILWLIDFHIGSNDIEDDGDIIFQQNLQKVKTLKAVNRKKINKKGVEEIAFLQVCVSHVSGTDNNLANSSLKYWWWL
jgi:hypothetical protein